MNEKNTIARALTGASAGLTALTLTALGAERQAPPPRPNIVIVLTDDVGWGDLRCYNPQSRIPTHNFDALAGAGMRFTDAHAPCAVCAPTRYAVLTGNYPWRGRTTKGAWNNRDGSDFLPGQLTFAHVARAQGYRTAILGKAGVGARVPKLANGRGLDWARPLEDGPVQWGFDFSHVLLQGHQAAPYFYHRNGMMVGDAARIINYPRPVVYTPETEIRFGGPGLPEWDSRAVGATLLDAADEFLDSVSNQPFLMYFNTAGSHGPHTPPGLIRGTPVRGRSGLHAKGDMVVEADVTCGHLLQSLERRGLLSNTVVFMASDNGGVPDMWDYKQESGHAVNGGLRGGKSLVWEGGHRVPLIVRWGDGTAAGSRIAPGSVSDELVGIHDIYATVAELMGAAPGVEQGRDSVSVLPVLLGQQPHGTPLREWLIASSDFRNSQALEPGEEGPAQPVYARSVPVNTIARAVRNGTWSLKFDTNNCAVALHDLSADLGETKNLINDPAQSNRIARMVAAYEEQYRAARTAPLLGAGKVGK